MDDIKIGESLENWHFELWYKLLAPKPNGKLRLIGIFKQKEFAEAVAKKELFGKNCKVKDVIIITKDGQTGFIVQAGSVDLPDIEEFRREAIRRILPKLDYEEIIILGLEHLVTESEQ